VYGILLPFLCGCRREMQAYRPVFPQGKRVGAPGTPTIRNAHSGCASEMPPFVW
jgi:hypothetical protein